MAGNTSDMIIGEATENDLDIVLAVERSAFGQADEAELVRALLSDPTARPALSLLAWRETTAIGHILFTSIAVTGEPRDASAALLAPLAVVPEAQGQGCGGALIEDGLRRLGATGVALVCVLGHPGFYRRHGFEPAGPHGLEAPYPIAAEHADAWMVRALREGVLGAITGRVRVADALAKPDYWRE